jgi:hypothetical protein
MSILSALRTQTDSIDDLAALPQAMIMQMAQRKQIREDMIAPILSRKAEMAEASARNQALKAQGQQPTIMEQLMQRNAVAEQPAPEQQTDVGIGQLPVNPGMFQEQSMAGGGIVAFAKGDLVEEMTEEERAEYIRNNPYLQRSQAIANIPAGFADFIKEYNPITGSKFREGISGLFSGDGMSTYEKGRKARTGEIPMFVGDKPTEKGNLVAEGKMRPDQNLQEVKNAEKRLADDAMKKFDQDTIAFEKERAAKLAANTNTLAGNVTTKNKEKPIEAVKEDALSKYEKMLMDAGESSKDAREDAKYMRLLEAGLNIMGGESPYALANIGKGASAAAKGYGEDVRGLRKEERERLKDLIEIQKERADVANKEKMLEVQRLAATKPSSVEFLAQLYKTDPELASKIQGQGKAGVMTFEEAYKAIAIDPKNMALSEIEKAQKARELMNLSTLGGGVQAQLPPGIPANSVQIGTSKGKPVYKAPDGKQYVVS